MPVTEKLSHVPDAWIDAARSTITEDMTDVNGADDAAFKIVNYINDDGPFTFHSRAAEVFMGDAENCLTLVTRALVYAHLIADITPYLTYSHHGNSHYGVLLSHRDDPHNIADISAGSTGRGYALGVETRKHLIGDSADLLRMMLDSNTENLPTWLFGALKDQDIGTNSAEFRRRLKDKPRCAMLITTGPEAIMHINHVFRSINKTQGL